MQGWEWITAARIISHKPVRLLALTITPSNTNAELTLYDGENTTAPVIVTLFTAVKVSWPFCFHHKLQTSRGLYIGSFTSITGVLVHWEVD